MLITQAAQVTKQPLAVSQRVCGLWQWSLLMPPVTMSTLKLLGLWGSTTVAIVTPSSVLLLLDRGQSVVFLKKSVKHTIVAVILKN